jgi:uncharacterized membrane protein YfhO
MNSSKKGNYRENPLIHFLKTRKIFLLIFILVSIGFFAFKEYLLFKKLYIFLDIGSDSYNQGYPYLVNIADYIRSEGVPFWSFSHGMGQNIFPGEITNPFILILYLLGSNYLAYGIAYVELLKMILAGVIFYYYLKTLSLSPVACITGGILMAFSGYMVLGSGWYGHSAFVLFGVFLLFSFEKLFKENKWYYFPFAIALIASRSPFYVYILGIFLLVYSIFRLLDEHRYDLKSASILYLKIVGAGMLGLAMVAPFLMNDVLRIMESPRIGGTAGYSNKLMAGSIFSFGEYNHNITALLRLFSNDILGTGSDYKGWYNYLEAPNFYCGLITLLLFPQIFYFLDKKRKVIFSGFLIIWILIIVFPFLRHALYLFTGDYYKGGVSFIISAVLLFYTLNALDHLDKNRGISVPLLFSTLGILVVLLYLPWFPADKTPVVKEIRTIVTSFLMIYALILFFYNKRATNVLRLALLVVICVEAYMFTSLTSNKRQVLTVDAFHQPVGYNDNTVKVLAAIKSKDKGFFRVEKDYSSGIAIHKSYNDAEIQTYYGTPSYNQFNQKYYIRFLTETGIIKGNDELSTRWAPGLSSRPLLQTVVGVKYYLRKNKPDNFLKSTYEPFCISGNVTALRNKYFLPLGFTYDKVISYGDFKKLSILEKDMVLLKAFVIENGEKDIQDFDVLDTNNMKKDYTIKEYGGDVDRLRRETMILTEHNQNSIKGTIQVSEKKLLFFSIPYDEGWTITIDGKKLKPKLINIGFMGVIISPGNHKVELSFRPPFLVSGTLIMILSFIFYMLFILKNNLGRNDINHLIRE